MQFSKIVYNSPGTDNGSNTSLNAEYVRLTNQTGRRSTSRAGPSGTPPGTSTRSRPTTSWAPGATAYVHTGKGTNGRPDSKHRYWNSKAYIWNNSGDTAYLRSPSGKSIDSCKWTSNKSQTYC